MSCDPNSRQIGDGGKIELRIGKMVLGPSKAAFVEQCLKTGAQFLQAALQHPRSSASQGAEYGLIDRVLVTRDDHRIL